MYLLSLNTPSLVSNSTVLNVFAVAGVVVVVVVVIVIVVVVVVVVVVQPPTLMLEQEDNYLNPGPYGGMHRTVLWCQCNVQEACC